MIRMPFANMNPIWLPSVMVADPEASAQLRPSSAVASRGAAHGRAGRIRGIDRRPQRGGAGVTEVGMMMKDFAPVASDRRVDLMACAGLAL